MTNIESTTEVILRKKYFLFSKRWLVVMMIFTSLAYGCLFFWNEFVYSVGSPSNRFEVEARKLGCTPFKPLPDEPIYIKNDGQQIADRQIWLLDRTRKFGRYLDYIEQHPECLAANILGHVGDPRGLEFTYYDRATNSPVVKVTIESIQ